MKLVVIILFLSVMVQNDSYYIYDFTNNKNTSGWYVVNDGVMGGLSQGKLTINDAGNGLFSGYVTTENNGGFSSIRFEFDPKDASRFENVILKLKGDGKSYQFRIKEKSSQRYSYISTFKTTGEWQVISLPFDSFYPGFRGNILDKPNYSGEIMEEVAILIGNKRKESFSLEIESISLK